MRRGPGGALLAIAVGLLAILLPAPAAEAAVRACPLDAAATQPAVAPAVWGLEVGRRDTSCATAHAVALAHLACRRAGCPRVIAGGWRCASLRRGFDRAATTGRFVCGAGRARVAGSYVQERTPCLGFGVLDPARTCPDDATSVTPDLRHIPRARGECSRPAGGGCAFGAGARAARRTVVIAGDSHVHHWRAGLEPLARRHGWRGYAFSQPGCLLLPIALPGRTECLDRFAQVMRFVRRHREVDTVFLTGDAVSPVTPDGGPASDARKLEAFRRVLRAIPAHVRHVVVLRDTVRLDRETQACAGRAITARRPLARVCPEPRAGALPPDQAALAALTQPDRRVTVLDISDLLCDPQSCFPVIGGSLVSTDSAGHLVATFMRTAAPLLDRRLAALHR